MSFYNKIPHFCYRHSLVSDITCSKISIITNQLGIYCFVCVRMFVCVYVCVSQCACLLCDNSKYILVALDNTCKTTDFCIARNIIFGESAL